MFFSSSILPFLLLVSGKLMVDAYQLQTKLGVLDGAVDKSRNGTKFYSFYAIPYAQPPIDDLRFEPPKEATSWEGVRNAKTPPPACIQTFLIAPHNAGNTSVMGEEDCLYLNVFTPNVSSSSSLPVLVYIHGGAFFSGSSSLYGPEYFMDYPVVVVTIQYRLAIFGFLSAADEILPGNYGMKDQIEALKWVQKNIADFGGDPQRVTIMGESAGGASVDLHLHSSLSTGLFHQAISQSGTALSPWAVIKSETAKERARALGVLSGCPELDSLALVECLRKIPAKQLALTHNKFFVYDLLPLTVFGPVVEPENVHNAFLIQSPWKQNVVNSVPLLTGITADEGSFFAYRIRSLSSILNEWTRRYDRLIPLTFYYFDINDFNSSAVTTSIKNFYLDNDDRNFQTGKNFSNMFGDGYFAATSLETAQRYSNKVYFYLYDYNNTLIATHGKVPKDLGVSHGSDLLSFFHLKGMFPPVTEGADYKVSQRILNYWVNFILKGEPNGNDQLWKPFSKENSEYLHIKADSDVMNEKLFNDRHRFWKETVFSSIELSAKN